MIFEIVEGLIFPADYRPLATELESQSLFFSPLWFDNFINTVVQPQDRVFWFGVRADHGDVLLLLPIWQQPHPRSMCATATLSSLENYYTTLYEPLHAINDLGLLSQAVSLVVQGICQQKWDVIGMHHINPLSQNYQLLINAFKQQGKYVEAYFMYGNWFLQTQNQCFKDYYAGRPGQLKNTIKRKGNKLKQMQIEYRMCQASEDVEEAVSLFQQIYQLSWKQNEPYPDFILGLAKIAAGQGWLRLGLLSVDGKAVAAQFWLTVQKTAYIYKLCQDPSFDSYSPGSQLTVYMMEYALDVDKVNKVDFLTGDDPYKKDWMSKREERWGLQIANPKTCHGLFVMLKSMVRLLLKRIPLFRGRI
jgi:hypothetical protein